MLKLTIGSKEYFNNETQTFEFRGGTTIELEHSLFALSKWEQKFEVPFLNNDKLTSEQMLYYIECMTLTPNVDQKLYLNLSAENVREVNEYLEKKHTATWFSNQAKGPGRRVSNEIVTAELIYFWMTACQIPFECEHWNLKRLLTLIQVCNEKNKPAKKMDRRTMMNKHRSANAARRSAAGHN